MITELSRVANRRPTEDIKVAHRSTHRHERGQVLVIVALAIVTLVAMVGLVIDGGFAWGKQRDTQNAADSAAKAGAIKLAEKLAGVVPAITDLEVLDAVTDNATANDIATLVAYYTNIQGQMITDTGALAADETDAAQVGGGTIPPGGAGVRAVADQTFDTFLVRVIGFTSLTVTADATAIAGYLTGLCEANAGCIVLPVTVPVTVLGCDGQNDPAPVTDINGNKILWTAPSEALTIPLCKNGPGNVGWLDWTPTAGGTSELVDAILTPSNPYLKWPGWYYITSTGNVNAATVENAINSYNGQVVLIPQFDVTCDTQPSGPGVEDCPPGNVGGNGSNQWYHLAGMSSFKLCTDDGSMPSCTDADGPVLTQGAYVTGSNPICDTGNGATSCLAGEFVQIVTEGEVTAAPGPNTGSSTVGIQLIE